MKKKLESELMSIAHKILKLRGKEDVNRMHEEVAALYEKLTILKFAQENFEDNDLPKIGSGSSFFGMLDTAFNNKVSDSIEIEDKVYVNLDDSENEAIMEPVMEKIKDIVAQMPQETQQVDDLIDAVTNNDSQFNKNDLENITADFKDTPVFDKVEETEPTIKNSDEKKSLNDKFGGLHIGLNDKLAFIKHLFDNKSEDYDRVISQLNTANSYTQAQRFIVDMVRPDYNNWEGKEDYETRFMEIIAARFD